VSPTARRRPCRAAVLAWALAAHSASAAPVIQWQGIAAPDDPAAQARVSDGARLLVDGRAHALTWRPLYYSGQRIGNQVAGTVLDADGKAVPDDSLGDRTVAFVSDTPDGTTLLRAADGSLQLVTHFEYVTSTARGYATGDTEFGGPNSRYGRLPGVIALARLTRADDPGALSVSGYRAADTAPAHGVWMPCAASRTPWGTHLGGEEYEPDARVYLQNPDPRATYMSAFNDYYYPRFRGTRTVSPYYYGYVFEVTAEGSVRKHYSMGRRSNELARVMPDSRTVYFGDDMPRGMLFMYVADRAGNLGAGTLYAARWRQRTDGGADLDWIRLGHANDADVEALIARGTTFADIFSAGDTTIRTGGNRTERLAVRPGMERAAAFLESRRYGALLGATAEFSKMEGVAVNGEDRVLYVSISAIRGGMQAAPDDPADHIRLARNAAGAVFALPLSGGHADTAGRPIESAWVATSMRAIADLTGAQMPADALGNRADPRRVANPDNLEYVPELRTLFVAEDSMYHLNNFLWAWPVDGGRPARVLSVPAGAEVSALHWDADVYGEGRLFAGYQHPGEWSRRVPSTVRAALKSLVEPGRGAVGYISGFGHETRPPGE